MNSRRNISDRFGAKRSRSSVICFLRLTLKVFKDEISFNFGGSEFLKGNSVFYYISEVRVQ